MEAVTWWGSSYCDVVMYILHSYITNNGKLYFACLSYRSNNLMRSGKVPSQTWEMVKLQQGKLTD